MRNATGKYVAGKRGNLGSGKISELFLTFVLLE